MLPLIITTPHVLRLNLERPSRSSASMFSDLLAKLGSKLAPGIATNPDFE